LLSQKHKNNKKEALNVYVGTANRLKKLALKKSLLLNDSRLKFMIVDCRVNKKGFTIFEQRESRDDLVDLVVLSEESVRRGMKIVTV
jgi:hypothetical protein